MLFSAVRSRNFFLHSLAGSLHPKQRPQALLCNILLVPLFEFVCTVQKNSAQSLRRLLSCNYHLHLYLNSHVHHFRFKPICNCIFEQSAAVQCGWMHSSISLGLSRSSIRFSSRVCVFAIVCCVARVLYHFLNLNCHQKFHLAFEICCVTDFWRGGVVMGALYFRIHSTHPSLSALLFLAIYSEFVLCFWSLFMPRNDTKMSEHWLRACVCVNVRKSNVSSKRINVMYVSLNGMRVV